MLDFAKVRAYYFDPPPEDPERIPAREELYARYERRRFEDCLLRGGDPEAEGLGPHGSLIGGPGKPLTLFHGFPELRARLRPLPLRWFDHSRGRTPIMPPGGLEEAHAFFASLSGAYLAGMRDRPSGPLLRRHFRSAELTRQARSRVADSGILHALLGLTDRTDVPSYPKVGASWEGFVIRQIVQLVRASPEQCFHWSTHTGAELDLLVLAGTRRYGFEVKRSEAPRLTRSMRSALETLKLDRLDVIHAGTERYRLGERVRALPAVELAGELRAVTRRWPEGP